MANNTTASITVSKSDWIEIADIGEQFIATPPEKSKTYIIFYKFLTVKPTSIIPAHRYAQTENSEGFVSGSIITSKCWARLSQSSNIESIDLSVTIVGEL